jgi:branched-chain amino acid transport system substrate-binding protein
MAAAKDFSRRKFLGYAATAVVVGAVGSVGGYYAGLSSIRPATLTTTTVTQTITSTITVPPPPESAPSHILVGASIPLSGPLASLGFEMKTGFEIVIDEINAAGGVYLARYRKKIPLKLIIYDSKSDPAVSASNIERLILEDKVVATFGGVSSSLALADAAAAEKHKKIYMCTMASTISLDKAPYKYVFVLFVSIVDMSKIIYKTLETFPPDERPKRVALWEEDSALGKELADADEEHCKQYGYTVVLREKYAPGTKDFTSLILKTKAARADMVSAIPTTTDGITMIKQSKELGFAPRLWVLHRASDPIGWIEALGKDGNYVMTAHSWSVGYVGKTYKSDFIFQEFVKRAGKEPASNAPGTTYSMVRTFVDAIQRANHLDSEEIRMALWDTDLFTPMGPIKFNENRRAAGWPSLDQWQDGKKVTVYPIELATGKLKFAPPWEER